MPCRHTSDAALAISSISRTAPAATARGRAHAASLSIFSYARRTTSRLRLTARRGSEAVNFCVANAIITALIFDVYGLRLPQSTMARHGEEGGLWLRPVSCKSLVSGATGRQGTTRVKLPIFLLSSLEIRAGHQPKDAKALGHEIPPDRLARRQGIDNEGDFPLCIGTKPTWRDVGLSRYDESRK